jgi:hypothetical protein
LQSFVDGSKSRLKDHLNQVWKTTGKKPNQLSEQPEFPEELRYIYDWYLEVKDVKQLTFTEIKNWSELSRTNIMAWEVDILKNIDRIYWNVVNAD